MGDKKYIGFSFEEWLDEEGVKDEIDSFLVVRCGDNNIFCEECFDKHASQYSEEEEAIA